MVLIIDTETTGLRGYPDDRVLEIGIAEYDELSKDIVPVYSELIRYDDMREFDSSYVNRDGTNGVWIYRNSDMTLEDTLNAEKDLATVVKEVREIVRGKAITSYNVGFDFGRFLYCEPWDLKWITARRYDVMELATEKVMNRARSDELEDKSLQNRLISEGCGINSRCVRSQDAYRALCPDDPMGLVNGQTHRALDDAVMEGWILRSILSDRTAPYVFRGRMKRRWNGNE